MIFDTIRYGTFTADDFINAHKSSDFSKFIQLPIDLRKKSISDVVDLHPNKESNKFKQAAFDFLDGKIDEAQFRNAYWKYWAVAEAVAAVAVAVATAVVVAAATAVVVAGSVLGVIEQYRPYFEQHAKHLNKMIKEYESC
jgi:hypothetical protein